MAATDVLVVVDSLGALTSGSLQDNVYLIDTNKYLGSWSEGQCELATTVKDTQQIVWRVTGVRPDVDVKINKFTGEAIPGLINPKKTGEGAGLCWEGTVEARGDYRKYQYSMELIFDNKKVMSFDPFINVVQ